MTTTSSPRRPKAAPVSSLGVELEQAAQEARRVELLLGRRHHRRDHLDEVVAGGARGQEDEDLGGAGGHAPRGAARALDAMA